MIVKIPCARCQATGTMILRDARYEGPYRCWKCLALFMVSLADGRVDACTPLSEEEFRQWQESAALREKQDKG